MLTGQVIYLHPEQRYFTVRFDSGGRETDYGRPEDNFAVIAQLWDVYVEHKCFEGETYLGVDAQDVANLMILQKLGRIISGTATADSYADITGYAACGCEIATCGGPVDAERTFDDMTYRGYRGSLRYSAEDKLYIGEVLGTKDYLCYHGKASWRQGCSSKCAWTGMWNSG